MVLTLEVDSILYDKKMKHLLQLCVRHVKKVRKYFKQGNNISSCLQESKM